MTEKMTKVSGLFAGLWISFVVAPTTALGQGRGFEPTDYYKMVTVGDVAVSPDGNLVAFTQTHILEEENRRRREVWMQALLNGRPDGEPYRFTDPTVDSYSPSWSPDGSLLSFTSTRGEDDNSTWFVHVAGRGGEAFHIEGVRGDPVWSEDGEWIVYLAEPDGSLPGEREGWIAPDALTGTLDPQRFDGRVVTSTRYKRDGTLSLRPHFSVEDATEL